MLSPAEAEAAIAASLSRLPALAVALGDLVGRVLRQTICFTRDQPPYDRVAMDGYALASGAWKQGLRRFRIVGVQAAGAQPLVCSSPHDCIEVMTGAVTPTGCDCVIPVEKIELLDGSIALQNGIEPSPWLNIHRRASDGKAGAQVIDAGTVLGPAEVAVIASCGYATVSASQTPTIGVLSTGDELKDPGTEVEAWQIWRSNSYAMLAALNKHGYVNCSHDHLPDDLDILRERLRRHLRNHDVLILSGGVSMGRFDYLPQVLEELGVKKIFHNVAQRPGKPMWFGVSADGKAVFALPGNPVSAVMCLRRYVLPSLLIASGATPVSSSIALATRFKAQSNVASLVPIQLVYDKRGHAEASPRPTQGSGDFVSLLGSDGFVELPPGDHAYEAGAIVSLYEW